MLDRPGNTLEERTKFSHDVGAKLPFVVDQEPEKILKNLDFPHTPYMVIALKKAETRAEWINEKNILIDTKAHLPIYEKTARQDNNWPVSQEVVK